MPIMCIMHGFMVDLGNNGFTNPIISSCLEISSAYNPFSSRFPFPVAIHRRNVWRVNGLHNIQGRLQDSGGPGHLQEMRPLTIHVGAIV